MIKIAEQFTCSKSNHEEQNEDAIFVSNAYIGVVDGATSKSGALFDGKTGGRLAAEYICEELEAATGTESAQELMSQIQQKLLRMERKYSLEEQGIHMAASLVIYNVQCRQIWSVGDCQFRMHNRTVQTTKRIDAILSELRAFRVNELLMGGYTIPQLMDDDLARGEILPFLKKQQEFENMDNEYGYAVLNGSATVPKVEIYPATPGTEIILASDGYPFVENTLAASESKLRYVLERDPLCYKLYKSTKGLKKGNISYDDRTYVRFVSE